MASNLAERPELTIWAQFVALIIFHSDLAIRYLPGLYSQIKGARGPKFQFEDCLTLILWVPLITYSAMYFGAVKNKPANATLFYACRIPLQMTLMCAELSRARMWFQIFGQFGKRARLYVVSTLFLGMLSVVMVGYPPFTEIQTYRGGVVTGAMVLNEMVGLVTIFSILRQLKQKMMLSLRFLCLGWTLRAMSTLVTACFGGFYLHTFWPQWSMPVVYIQQCNLIVSIVFARGIGMVSLVNQCRSKAQDVQPNDQRGTNTTDAPVDTYALTGERNHTTEDDPDRTNSDSCTTIETDAMSNIGITGEDKLHDNINSSSPHKILDDSTFSSSDNIDGNTSDGITDDNSAGNNSSEGKDYLLEFQVLGIWREHSQNGDEWWFLCKAQDKIFYAGDWLEQQPIDYGYMETSRIENGYCYFQFLPRWIPSSKVPEDCTRRAWESIGRRFWQVTCSTSSSDDSFRWDGVCSEYSNLSKGWKLHLCGILDCEDCLRFDM